MKKGKDGNSKGSYYWRNKIKNERKPLPAKFRARIRSKGEKPNYTKSKPPVKGQKWQNKIRAERGLKPLKSIGLGKTSSIVTKKRLAKIRMPSSKEKVKQTINLKPIKNSNIKKNIKIQTPFKGKGIVSQRLTKKRNLNQVKKRQKIEKKPMPTIKKPPSKGIQMLKKIEPNKAQLKTQSTPSKSSNGIQRLKNSVSKGTFIPKNVVLKKRPVIKKGR